jgi:hypothetical protein
MVAHIQKHVLALHAYMGPVVQKADSDFLGFLKLVVDWYNPH